MSEQKRRGRGRPAILRTELVHMAERASVLADEVAESIRERAEREPRQTSRQRALEANRAAAEAIELAMNSPRAFDPEMVSPGADFALTTPPPIGGRENHILHITTRNQPDLLAVLDIESSGLIASVLHHSMMLLVRPGNYITVGLNEQPITQFVEWDDAAAAAFQDGHAMLARTWSTAIEGIRGVMRALIDQQTALGMNRGRAKVYAHNGARFDWSGLALSLGIDRSTGRREDMVHRGKKRSLLWSIEDFGGKPRIYLACGSGGSFKVELVDSNWILNAPLDQLSGETKKGRLPEMFGNTDRWLKGQGHDVPAVELDAYRKQAHLAELDENGRWVTHYEERDGELVRGVEPLVSDEHPFGTPISNRAVAAFTHWKATLPQREREYSRNDVIVLANALSRFDEVCQRIGIPGSFAFNTSAMVGHAALVRGVYEQSVRRLQGGEETPRFALSRPRYGYFRNGQVALLPSDKSAYIEQHGTLPREVDRELEAATEDEENDDEEQKEELIFQHHGIITRRSNLATIVKNPWYCTKRVNQWFKVVQRGGRCEVFAARNLPGTAMVSIDAKSMYPSIMARGVTARVQIDGRSVESAVLRDYVDPRLLKSGWSFGESEDVRYQGISFVPSDDPVTGMTTWSVRGRESVLRFLQLRGGMFFAKLPRTACEFFRKYPVIPMTTMGSDVEAKLVFPDWKGLLNIHITGEELAYFLSEPTIDDERVEINLSRSMHAMLLSNQNLFGRFVGEVFKARSGSEEDARSMRRQAADLRERMRAGEAVSLEEIERLEGMSNAKTAEAQILKLVLNSGGYGTLAQQSAPEVDINLENLHQVVGALERIRLDAPLWEPVHWHAVALDKAVAAIDPSHRCSTLESAPGWPELIASASKAARLMGPAWKVIRGAEEYVSKRGTISATIEDVIKTISMRVDKADLIGEIEGDDHQAIADAIARFELRMKTLRSCYSSIFTDYARAHMARHSQYSSRSPSGRNVEHFLLTLIENTADYAIRPWACAITAKARVSKHLAIRALYEAGVAQILYGDTDSVHFSVYCLPGQNPNEIAAELLSRQRFITIGNQLGQWQIEVKRVREGLAVPGKPEGSDFVCWNVYYASKKAYVMADEHLNVLDCRARGVARKEARRQAAFLDYRARISKLGDRRGIRIDNEEKVDLLENRKVTSLVYEGDKTSTVTSRICGLFANFTRRYDSPYDSEAMLLDPEQLGLQKGEEISPRDLAARFYEQMPFKAVARGGKEFYGLEVALSDYLRNWKIGGMAVSDARQSIRDEIDSFLDRIKAADEGFMPDAEVQERLLDEQFYDDLPF